MITDSELAERGYIKQDGVLAWTKEILSFHERPAVISVYNVDNLVYKVVLFYQRRGNQTMTVTFDGYSHEGLLANLESIEEKALYLGVMSL